MSTRKIDYFHRKLNRRLRKQTAFPASKTAVSPVFSIFSAHHAKNTGTPTPDQAVFRGRYSTPTRPDRKKCPQKHIPNVPFTKLYHNFWPSQCQGPITKFFAPSLPERNLCFYRRLRLLAQFVAPLQPRCRCSFDLASPTCEETGLYGQIARKALPWTNQTIMSVPHWTYRRRRSRANPPTKSKANVAGSGMRKWSFCIQYVV